MYIDYNLREKVKKLEQLFQCVYCKVKDGIGKDETDPIFTLSPAFNITQTDIDNWNQGGATPNLQQITDVGYTSTNPLDINNWISGLNILVKNNVTSRVGVISSANLQSSQTYLLPDKSGSFALIDDITMQSSYNGGNKISNFINAQGDPAFTKRIVAKVDGTIGWEDKLNSLPIIPKVEIVSFKTSDATNFILTVVLTGVVGSMTSPYWRIFVSSGTGTNVEATGIQVLSQDTANYQLPNSINAISAQQQIIFPKSSNPSALWTNTAATSIMITAEFIGAHNTDVASGVTYSVPRVGIDTKLKNKILI